MFPDASFLSLKPPNYRSKYCIYCKIPLAGDGVPEGLIMALAAQDYLRAPPSLP
jgi:hypothetical protein